MDVVREDGMKGKKKVGGVVVVGLGRREGKGNHHRRRVSSTSEMGLSMSAH